MITSESTPTVAIWKFAALHKYRELGSYCLKNCAVYELLREIFVRSPKMGDPKETLETFLEAGYLYTAVADATRRMLNSQDREGQKKANHCVTSYSINCTKVSAGKVCNYCRVKYA